MAYRRCVPLFMVLVAAGGALVMGTSQQPWPDAAALQTMTARCAPVDIGADLSALAPGERRALDRLSHVPVDIEPRFVTADHLQGLE